MILRPFVLMLTVVLILFGSAFPAGSYALEDEPGTAAADTDTAADAVPEAPADANEDASGPVMPAASFTGKANGIDVSAEAPEGTFPEGTVMKVSKVSQEDVSGQIDTVTNNALVFVRAVDISFFGADGSELEPAGDQSVNVSLTLSGSAGSEEADSYSVVHINDEGDAEIVSDATSEGAEFRADSFSVYAIIGTDDSAAPKTITYNFYNRESDSKPSVTVSVKSGETLYRPATPATDANTEFIGWFAKGSDTPFEGFGPVGKIEKNSTVNVYGRYRQYYYVRYYDVSGEVLSQEKVSKGTKIIIDDTFPIVNAGSITAHHKGWTLKKGSYDIISGEQTVTGDMDLYPVTEEGNWVSFDTDGGSHVARQFVTRHFPKAERPSHDPHKTGYVFDGWYADSSRRTPFDFSSSISGPVTIYAKWKPADDTPYLVIYWIEYQTDEKADTWGYKKAAQEKLTGTTGEQTSFDPETVFRAPYSLSVTGYSFDSKRSVNKTIRADGKTVVNTYYTCNNMTFELKGIPEKEGSGKYNVSVTRKYSASIKDVWEGIDKRTGLDKVFDGRHRFSANGAFIDDPTDKYYLTSDYSGTYISRGTENYFYRIYRQTLEGKAPEGKDVVTNQSAKIRLGYVTDTRTYYLKEREGFNSGIKAGVGFSSYTSEGFSLKAGLSEGNWSLRSSSALVNFNIPDSRYLGWYYGLDNTVSSSIYYSWRNDPRDGKEFTVYRETDGYLDIYYTRNRYDLLFSENGGPDIEDKKVYYEKALAGYEPSGYVRGVTKRTLPDGHSYTFDGWYLDDSYTELFGFDYETMPDHDVHLYAHWIPATYTVTFDSNGGTEVPAETDVEYGDTVPEPTDVTKKGHALLGWTLNGKPFHFDSEITGDITLVAQWTDQKKHTVSYDIAGGSGKVPVDKHYYASNSAARVLPADGVTPPSGKVFLYWSYGDDYYYPGDMVSLPEESITLTAVYEPVHETTRLTYDFNFAQFGIKTGLEKSHTDPALRNNGRVRLRDISALMDTSVVNGYEFTGWHLKKDCSGPAITEVQIDRDNEENNIVYAGWKKTEEGKDSGSRDSGGKGSLAPDTSDDGHALLHFAALMLSAALLSILFCIRKRRSETDQE